MASLSAIPDELVSQILHHVAPVETLANVQLLSRRCQQIANEPLLWRFYCETTFRYWSPEHRFEAKLRGLATDTDWKQLWMMRRRTNARIDRLLDGVMATQIGRMKRFEQICKLGYDAKDFLLEQQALTDDDTGDALARRYWAKRALGSIHRETAIEYWTRLRQVDAEPSFEEALGSFDMFVLPPDGNGGVSEIVRGLDLLASDFSRSNPDFAQLTIRGKAIALLAWLRSHQRVGLNGPESGYRNLRNCLLGQALLREGHCSIPIMSCAIYSCVAQRLGLDAAPVSFPAHVRVMVSATPEMDLDGGPRQLGTPGWSERMFLDPFGSDQELPQTEVRMIMRLYNIFDYPGTHDYTWLGAEPANLVQRNAHNIIETSNQWAMRSEEPDSEDDRPSMLANLGHGDPETNIMTAAHAGLWALVFSTPFEDHLWRDYYKKFLGNIVTSWNDEAWLLEKYVLPLDEEFAKYDGRPRSSFDSAADTLRFLRNRDQRGPTVHRRYTEEINRKVKYRVGQVFRHARYRYIGIIVGWDPDGRATFPGGNYSWTSEDESSDERGIGGVFRHLGAAGRHPTGVYYQCLRTAWQDPCIVRQSNIEIVTDTSVLPDSMIQAAGRFFKRFDKESCTFVSNVKELYPDD